MDIILAIVKLVLMNLVLDPRIFTRFLERDFMDSEIACK